MKLVSRQYQPGDERYINVLYKKVTNRNRSIDEYKWEWLETWNGRGNIWLLFDQDREEDDRLIGQFSLIPTPVHILGDIYLTGKTENCMMHPDYKGKSLYFPHEEKYFQKAKEKYKIFFTTTANEGLAWAVRQKLKYTPLDIWANYYYFLNTNFLKENIQLQIKKKFKSLGLVANLISYLFSIYYLFFKQLKRRSFVKNVKMYDEQNAPLSEIENLWTDNKDIFVISIDRNKEYLEWRINKNPYHNHFYLAQYSEGKLLGYLIFYKDKKNVIRIVDIIAEHKRIDIYNNLVFNLVHHASNEKVYAISFSTLKSDKFLRKVFSKSGFINMNYLVGKNTFKKNKIMDFYVYIKRNIQNVNTHNPRNWYVTDLFKEGR